MHSNVTAMVIQSHQDPSKRDVRSNCRQWTKLISCTWHNNKYKKTVRIAQGNPKWPNIFARHISLNILSATQFWDFVINWILGQPEDLIAGTGQSSLVALGEPFVTFFSPYPLKPTVMHYYSPIKSHGHGHIILFRNKVPCFCFISSCSCFISKLTC